MLGKDDHVFLMRAREASHELPEALENAGISYTDIALYHTAVDMRKAEELGRLLKEVDYVTFCSGSAVRAFASMTEGQDFAAKVVCIGPVTERAAEKAGMRIYPDPSFRHIAVQSGAVLGTEYTLEQLSDFDFLKNNFYIVESNTDISSDLLDAETLLGMDMTMKQDSSAPQILIYHTHSQEGFVDSVPGDSSTTIVGVGEYLAELLRDTYGYNVIHNTGVYDFIDGKLDRNQAYTLAAEDVEQILAENPTIEVVIDLHRDGVQEDTHLVTEVNGKTTAQIMFFNGLSFSKRNGPIGYLENPYIGENLALSLQMKLGCEKYYPGFTRKVYLKSLRYNLHLRPKSLLVEAGAQTNTLQEMLNAMEPLAYVLNQVLKGN